MRAYIPLGFIISILVPGLLWAQDPVIHYMTTDPQLNPNDFIFKNHEIYQDSPAESPLVIEPSERDKLILSVGVKELNQWDHLDKDIFMLRIENLSPAEIRLHYPILKSENIQKLKIAIMNYRTQERQK